MTSSHQIPVTVLTGFLGSGKTTLLKRLLRHPRMANAMVIINEFGAISIDHDLIESVNEDTVLLQNGCLCCMVRNDLVDTLRDLHSKRARGACPPFDRVLIETTGLADPAPILQTLMADEGLAGRYGLNGVIATVDAVVGAVTMDRYVEAVRQAAVAERLAITKSDLADEATVAKLKQRLRALNPSAPIETVVDGAVDPELFFDLGFYDIEAKSFEVGKWIEDARPSESHSHETHAHDAMHSADRSEAHRYDVSAVCVTLDRPVDGEALDRWLQTLLRDKGPDLLRFKAIIHVRRLAGPLVLHAVQHVVHPPAMLPKWPSDDRRSRFVLIGHGLVEQQIRESLQSLVAEPIPAH